MTNSSNLMIKNRRLNSINLMVLGLYKVCIGSKRAVLFLDFLKIGKITKFENNFCYFGSNGLLFDEPMCFGLKQALF